MTQYYRDNVDGKLECPRVLFAVYNNHYWHGLNVYIAQYYGDNVPDMLDCLKGVPAA